MLNAERGILDAIATGLVVVATDRSIAHWNQWIAAASRRAAADVVGRPARDVLSGERAAALHRAIDSAIDTGVSTLLTHVLHRELLPLKTLAGRPLLHDVMVLPIGGAPGKGCIVQVADVTEQTRRERFLRERQNARYDALVESAPDVILNVDASGLIQVTNPAAERQFGYAAEQLVGAKADLLFETEGTWARITGSVNAANPPVHPMEVQVRLKSGAVRYFEVSAARWHDGTREFVTAIFRDVHDRRQTEIALRESERRARENAAALGEANAALKASGKRLNEMDRRKDEFLATLAHELRNPLAPLRNGLQLLKLAKDDPALIERTRNMMDLQLAQMVRLIDDLLDVSRINNDRLDLNKEVTSLDKIIRQAVETSQPLLDALQHNLSIDLPRHEVVLEADVVRLTQVFANLLNNAAKYTPRGGTISIEGRHQGRDMSVSITDNGIGIPKEMLPKVFDMFVQVDKSLERAQGGLGIGLSLVKRLVELHGGTVEGQSKGLGAGSKFVVRLPAALDSEAVDSSTLEATTPEQSNVRRILVADDNEDAAMSLALILSMLGHETRTARNGLEALDIAEQFQPDVVLLDIGMPKLNGYETARRLRAKPDGDELLLVALTGWGQESDRLRSTDAGFDSHLIKPVDVAKIQQLLTEKRGRPGAQRGLSTSPHTTH
jgi:PAS domain S-box-containing protein